MSAVDKLGNLTRSSLREESSRLCVYSEQRLQVFCLKVT